MKLISVDILVGYWVGPSRWFAWCYKVI